MAGTVPATEEERLREALVEGRLLKDVQVRVVLDYQRSVGGTLRDIVLRLGFMTAEELDAALEGANRVSVTTGMIAGELVRKAPFRLLRGYRVIPVRYEGETVLAAEDAELEPIVREELWSLLGTQLPVVQAEPGTVIATLDVLADAQKAEESSGAIMPEVTLPELVGILLKRGVIASEDLVNATKQD
jgi:hypothetical protein